MRRIAFVLIFSASLFGADRAAVERYAASGQRLIPHYAAGGDWFTTVRIANPDTVVQRFRLNSFDAQGTAQQLLYNGAAKASLDGTVPAVGVVDIVLTASDGLKTGMLTLDFPDNPYMKLPVTVFYRTVPPYDTEGAVTWDGSDTLASPFIQFDNTAGTSTGMAVADLSPVPQGANTRIEVSCFDQYGNALGSFTALTAGAQQTHFDLASKLNSTGGNKGICKFRYFSDSGSSVQTDLVPLSLQFKGVNFLPLK